MEKIGEKQYFFVPGGFDAKLHKVCFKQWRQAESKETVKKFTYMGGSYYFAQHLSSSARYTELRNLIFTVIGRQHVGWDIYNFAMADTDEERMRKFPPPPTVPLQRSKLSLGPDALPATNGQTNDVTITSSACAEALEDFVNPAAVS